MRRSHETSVDNVSARMAPAAPPTRRLLLFATLPLVPLVLLQVKTARADNCGAARQTCTAEGQAFCGGDRLAGCLYTCCPDNGCCLFSDNIGVNGAQCCPSDPNLDAACTPGCTYTCTRPCGATKCCSTAQNEVCIRAAVPGADGTCCPSGQVCGIAFQSCCTPPDVCTPAGVCCPSADDVVCGNDECCHGLCCNGQCCPANSLCYGDRFCCAQHQQPCGDKCCDVNEKCKHKRKSDVCKCKKKGRKCAGHRCCAGDVCLDGQCVPPLPF